MSLPLSLENIRYIVFRNMFTFQRVISREVTFFVLRKTEQQIHVIIYQNIYLSSKNKYLKLLQI